MILAGDVGGTKCNLALFSREGNALRRIFQCRLATRDYPSFEDLIANFLQQATNGASSVTPAIQAAALAVAGMIT